MRKINYILIDSNTESHDGKPDHHHVLDGRHHYCVNRQGLVTNDVDIRKIINLVEGPIYDRNKFNRCSIGIHYCGSLRPETWMTEPATGCKTMMQQRKALLKLLAGLRKHFPDAKILGVAEINGKASNNDHFIVSDALNVLRKEMSDLP